MHRPGTGLIGVLSRLLEAQRLLPTGLRVARKCGYEFDHLLPAASPSHPLDGHLHIRHASA
jgi:hypothetical protein